MAIRHSTPADLSFTPLGKAAWDAGHDGDASDLAFVPSGTGATASTVQTELRRTVWVEHFGAVADGVTDCTTAFRNAIAKLTSGGTVRFSTGTYRVTGDITIATSCIQLLGDGMGATVIKYDPTATGTLFSFTKGASIIQYCSLRKMQLYSADATYTKTAIKVSDGDTTVFEDVLINGGVVVGSTSYWSGSNSIGIQSNGRQIGLFKNVTVIADKPIVIGTNPNNAISIDHYNFHDLFMIGNGNPLVTINTGVNLSNVSFTGMQAWVLGTDGIKWADTTTSIVSNNLFLENVRWEQGSSATNYVIDISHNTGLKGLTLKNITLDPGRKGFKLRKVLWVSIENMIGAAVEEINVDATVGDIDFKNCDWSTGTATMTGQRQVLGMPQNTLLFSAAPLPSTGHYGTNATAQAGSWNTIVGGAIGESSITVANNADAWVAPGTGCGAFMIVDSECLPAIYTLNGSQNSTSESFDPGNAYTNAVGGAASTNVYYDAGSTSYRIQNKRGASRVYKFILLGSSSIPA